MLHLFGWLVHHTWQLFVGGFLGYQWGGYVKEKVLAEEQKLKAKL